MSFLKTESIFSFLAQLISPSYENLRNSDFKGITIHFLTLNG